MVTSQKINDLQLVDSLLKGVERLQRTVTFGQDKVNIQMEWEDHEDLVFDILEAVERLQELNGEK
jgi:hypothetical protein